MRPKYTQHHAKPSTALRCTGDRLKNFIPGKTFTCGFKRYVMRISTGNRDARTMPNLYELSFLLFFFRMKHETRENCERLCVKPAQVMTTVRAKPTVTQLRRVPSVSQPPSGSAVPTMRMKRAIRMVMSSMTVETGRSKYASRGGVLT